jgi:hypothetical protein
MPVHRKMTITAVYLTLYCAAMMPSFLPSAGHAAARPMAMPMPQMNHCAMTLS